MNLVPYSNEILEYLSADEIIDYNNESVTPLADALFQNTDTQLEYIKLAYEFVRDHISHSADISNDSKNIKSGLDLM